MKKLDKVLLALQLCISLSVGIAVSTISIACAWLNEGGVWTLNPGFDTVRSLRMINTLITDYKSEMLVLPVSLGQLRELPSSHYLQFEDDGSILDYWGRPLQYMADGELYTVQSYGRDGKPGGRGLDYDVSNHDMQSKNYFPTLGQFLFEMHTQKLVLACIGCGVLSFLTCLATTRGSDFRRGGRLPLAVRLIFTILAAIIVAVFMSALEVPSGH